MSAEIKKGALEVADLIWNVAVVYKNEQVAKVKWVGGALQGGFNDKATVGQIVFDAILSMFPIAGEATAVRDLTAVIIKMIDDGEEAKIVLNWVTVVLCLLPIVPVFGGVAKGIGMLLVTVLNDVTRAEEIAKAIVSFLRKMGYGDPVKFLKELNFSKYQPAVLNGFNQAIDRLKQGSVFITKHMTLPENVQNWLIKLPPKLDQLSQLASKMIPQAIKELNVALDKVRTHLTTHMNEKGIKIGGVTTKAKVNEARLVSQSALKIASKGHTPATLEHYKHKEGWSDLRDRPEDLPNGDKFYPTIASFSSKAPITPEILKAGSRNPIFRVVEQAGPRNTGPFWAEKMSENGWLWRLYCAVKGAWSKNGAYVTLDHIPTIEEMRKLGITVPDGWDGLRIWRGKIAEQLDNESNVEKGIQATNILLPGGDIQLFINFWDPHNAPVAEYIKKVIKEKPTNWADAEIPLTTDVIVNYLTKHEQSAKIVSEGRTSRTVSASGRAVVSPNQSDQQQ